MWAGPAGPTLRTLPEIGKFGPWPGRSDERRLGELVATVNPYVRCGGIVGYKCQILPGFNGRQLSYAAPKGFKDCPAAATGSIKIKAFRDWYRAAPRLFLSKG